jgi:hypothetical protein
MRFNHHVINNIETKGKTLWTHRQTKKSAAPNALFSVRFLWILPSPETNRVFAVPVAALNSEYSTINIRNAMRTYVNNTKWLYHELGKTGIQKRETVMAHVYKRPPAALEIQAQRDGPVTQQVEINTVSGDSRLASASFPGENQVLSAPFLACFCSISAWHLTMQAHPCRFLPRFSVFSRVSPYSPAFLPSPYGMLFLEAVVTDAQHTSERASGGVRFLTKNAQVFYLVSAQATCYADQAQGPGTTASKNAGTFPRAFVTWNKYASVCRGSSADLHRSFSGCMLLSLASRVEKGKQSMATRPHGRIKAHSDKGTPAELEIQAQQDRPVTQRGERGTVSGEARLALAPSGTNQVLSGPFLARFWPVSGCFCSVSNSFPPSSATLELNAPAKKQRGTTMEHQKRNVHSPREKQHEGGIGHV